MTHAELMICESELIDFLGYESLYNQLSLALSDSTLEDCLAYIARVNDIKTTYKMEEV